MTYKFDWDSAKAASNLQKHGVDFETAIQVFDDPFAIHEEDRVEDGELRWQALGMIGGFVFVLVVYCSEDEENGSEYIRIISARRADKSERKRYEQAYIQAHR